MELIVNKPIGITSYDVIRKLKRKYPGEKIGHAGTLDPLANGVLICLTGKDNKNQSKYMNLEKDYVFEVLFGFKTDTYDILGLVKDYKEYDIDIIRKKIIDLIDKYKGKMIQSVPPFSAVKVKGRPLYKWYLDGKINQIKIPKREIEIKNIELVNKEIISKDRLTIKIIDTVNTVKKGFRQKEIINKWNKITKSINQNNFLLVTIRASTSKGTYVRGIADDIGDKLGCFACTIKIIRTKVGDFKFEDAVEI